MRHNYAQYRAFTPQPDCGDPATFCDRNWNAFDFAAEADDMPDTEFALHVAAGAPVDECEDRLQRFMRRHVDALPNPRGRPPLESRNKAIITAVQQHVDRGSELMAAYELVASEFSRSAEHVRRICAGKVSTPKSRAATERKFGQPFRG